MTTRPRPILGHICTETTKPILCPVCPNDRESPSPETRTPRPCCRPKKRLYGSWIAPTTSSPETGIACSAASSRVSLRGRSSEGDSSSKRGEPHEDCHSIAAIVRRLFKQHATGTHTKQEILRKAKQWGLTNRRGQPLSSQAIGMPLRNRLYVGIIDVPEFGVRDQRGSFEPLFSGHLVPATSP